MAKTIQVTLELVYEQGPGYRQIRDDVDAAIAKVDLQGVDWKRMSAKKVKITGIEQITTR